MKPLPSSSIGNDCKLWVLTPAPINSVRRRVSQVATLTRPDVCRAWTLIGDAVEDQDACPDRTRAGSFPRQDAFQDMMIFFFLYFGTVY